MRWSQKLLSLFACLFLSLLIFNVASALRAEETGIPAPETAKTSHYFIVTYFHASYRCPTCKKLETYSAEAIKNNFAEELKNGSLVWRTFNTDEPEDEHYNNDYQLYTKSLIISEIKDGKEIRWKNLEKIWTYVQDKQKFEQYVVSEIKDWLKE